MAKEFKGDALPMIAAAPGNPGGVQATEDITFKGVVVVHKDQWYSGAYLAAVEAGCEQPAKNKKAE